MSPRRLVVAVGLIGLLALGGCASDGDREPSASPSATATATATATADATVELDCDALLPVSRASAALGLPSGEFSGSIAQPKKYSVELVREAAQKNGGLLDCGWYDEDGSAQLRVLALQDAAQAFAVTAPGAGAESGGLAPAAIGDSAYASCHDGEGAGCTAEVLVGDTWLSVSQRPRPADDAGFVALASAIAADARGRIEPPSLATAPECGAVLTAADLTATAGLTAPVLGSVEQAGDIRAVARDRAGYLSCSWTDASGSGSVLVSAAPDAHDAWDQLALSSNMFVPLEPIDGIGDRALAGCGATGCEVDAVQDDTWWRIAVSSDAAQATAVAGAVLAR